VLLEISYIEELHDPKYRVLADGVYVIGGGRCDILLADSTVAPQHAQLTIEGGRITIADLRSPTGTFVDDERIAAPTDVDPGQPIRVGDTLLRVTIGERAPVKNYSEQRTMTETENAFLAALLANPADDGTRLVYADWLEAEGHRFAAHYIRAELANDVDVDRNEMTGKAVWGRTTPEWRVLIRRAQFGGCYLENCPTYWHMLEANRQRIFERMCGKCHQPVLYCRSTGEVATAGETKLRVVFDAGMGLASNADAYYRGHYYWEPGRSIDASAYERLFPPRRGRTGR
jgi:uncharacterized protein (TIGR02996 family)